MPARDAPGMGLVVAGRLTPTNVALRDAAVRMGASARLLPPEVAERRAQPDDVVLGRVDVRPELDGVDPGLDSLERLAADGMRVLNPADGLAAAHDKLETAVRIAAAGLPHPWTAHLEPEGSLPAIAPPLVLKPRFGSWGADVVRCETRREVERALKRIRRTSWYRSSGVLVQELIPPPGADLRIVVAGGGVVGAVHRVAAPGEWRTNVALGGTRRAALPSPDACALALDAAAAVGLDLVGVDLLPSPGGYTILELNGCVDFTVDYGILGGDVFALAVERLLFPHVAELETRTPSPDELPVPG
jgi:ribosomal protein S6--L-glutamate ligase